MPVALGAFGESGADFFEVEADQAAFVNFRVDHLVAVEAEDGAVSETEFLGQGVGGKERGLGFHAAPPSS